jgi:hypothetical protein
VNGKNIISRGLRFSNISNGDNSNRKENPRFGNRRENPRFSSRKENLRFSNKRENLSFSNRNPLSLKENLNGEKENIESRRAGYRLSFGLRSLMCHLSPNIAG